MTEIISGKTGSSTTGMFRRELLENSQRLLFNAKTPGDVITASLHIRSFVATLDKNGEPFKLIIKEIEKIRAGTVERTREFEKNQDQRESLQRFDHQNDIVGIYIDDVMEQYQICQGISEKFGLFND